MASLFNKRKLATVIRETRQQHARNNRSRKGAVTQLNEGYITQGSEET